MRTLFTLLILTWSCVVSLRRIGVATNKVARVACMKLAAKSGSDKVYVCTECGMEHINWMGRCSSCNEWNCVKPMRLPKLSGKQSRPLDPRSIVSGGHGKAWLPNTDQSGGMIGMNSIDISETTLRHTLRSGELNRVLGGGLVRGSTILLAGEPGIGKSTLLIQLANDIVTNKRGTVVYISGEENPQQIAARAARLKLSTDGIFVLCDCDTDRAGMLQYCHNHMKYYGICLYNNTMLIICYYSANDSNDVGNRRHRSAGACHCGLRTNNDVIVQRELSGQCGTDSRLHSPTGATRKAHRCVYFD